MSYFTAILRRTMSVRISVQNDRVSPVSEHCWAGLRSLQRILLRIRRRPALAARACARHTHLAAFACRICRAAPRRLTCAGGPDRLGPSVRPRAGMGALLPSIIPATELVNWTGPRSLRRDDQDCKSPATRRQFRNGVSPDFSGGRAAQWRPTCGR